ncbi:hypothetical protein J2741_002070 [Methanolinea mesophila]|uniref:hypothetical protein n=1 Tax=Methanolinea mesophila TaxID=547055 RepID=UPI001AE18AFB|nr:hypothetical protein [Methanolinea mesophila]MBP1929523.1 hypothetical protein [Methanolinea mesophila]
MSDIPVKAVLAAGILGGIWLFIMTYLGSNAGTMTAPYDIMTIGGMRGETDPVLAFFFLYPFVLSFTSAIVFGMVRTSLEGPDIRQGLHFGLIMILLVMVPSLYVIYTSMTYPPGFFIGSLFTDLIGFPVLGILYARIWSGMAGKQKANSPAAGE